MLYEDTPSTRPPTPLSPGSRSAADALVAALPLLFVSRALDALEEDELAPQRKIFYQFGAQGHDLAQILLGRLLHHPHDGVGVYYRSRPLLLALGLDLVDAIAGPLGRSGGMSGGRDIGVVFNLPGRGGPTALPMAGDVGAQYTPAVGWAQALRYHEQVLGDEAYAGAIAVATGGEASTATNGFWSAVNIAATQQLPVLFVIEDNGYGVSVPSTTQMPGGDIARNLGALPGLRVLSGDGACPAAAPELLQEAVAHVRAGEGPMLLRLRVPRLRGHSGADKQRYKSEATLEAERRRDPLSRARAQLVPAQLSERQWSALQRTAEGQVRAALAAALERPAPDPASARRHAFQEHDAEGRPDVAERGGLPSAGYPLPAGATEPSPEAGPITLVTALRRTLEQELALNPRLLVFGEDVGQMGGVHGVTKGLQGRFGDQRVFDTSLSEEGIIGRAVGMAMAGLMPVAEVQFRKFMDAATEQLHNCGTLRWRTDNRFAAPIVVRTPVGHAACGDVWHSMSEEVHFCHAVGWRVAMPSNATDAVGLLRAAMRGSDPTVFFEHRALLAHPWAARPYPGDDFVLPFGVAATLTTGDALTLVSWGAMVERCARAVEATGASVELIDLRTLSPWDRDAVVRSVEKTRRCLIVHEDRRTAGFGAEIAATLTEDCFFALDAPIRRLAVPDVPVPYAWGLMQAVLPSVDEIQEAVEALVRF